MSVRRLATMTRPSFAVRTAITLFVLPFFIGGIFLAAVPYSWLYESLTGDARIWLFPSLVFLAFSGILLGALLAYGVLVFTLSWVRPRRPLLNMEVERPGLALRFLAPAFSCVRRIAESLVPNRR